VVSGERSAALEALLRWEDAGGTWRLVAARGGVVTIGLLTCDGGEQVGELRCPEVAVQEFLGGRVSNEAD